MIIKLFLLLKISAAQFSPCFDNEINFLSCCAGANTNRKEDNPCWVGGYTFDRCCKGSNILTHLDYATFHSITPGDDLSCGCGANVLSKGKGAKFGYEHAICKMRRESKKGISMNITFVTNFSCLRA